MLHEPDSTQGPLTVEAALRLPSMRRGAPRVVAGRDGLTRAIRWAHSSEVRNVAELLKGGELLLTTGMPLGRRPAEQRAFVRELARCGIAALAIELGQVHDEAPPAVVEEAEAHGLPLVVLQREVRFVEVTEQIHERILEAQAQARRRADALGDRLAHMLLDGAETPELLAAVADVVANPVLLVRDDGVAFHALHRAPSEAVLAEWELVAAAEADGRAQTDGDGAPPGDEAVAFPVPAAGGRAWGRLVALALDTPVDELTPLALERAAATLALALARRGQDDLLSSRQRGNFLADLLHGRVGPDDAGGRAIALGLAELPWPLLTLVLAPAAPAQAGADHDEAEWAATWRDLREELAARGLPGLIGWRTREQVAPLLVQQGARERRAAIEQIVDAVRAAARRQLGRSDAVVVAAGPTATDWDATAAGLRCALEAATVARSATPRRWHDATVADLDRLLWSLRDEPHLREFAVQRLAPLIEHDHRRAAKLLPTLQALCDHHWRKAETARALYINRQSLYPRIERIERILGADFDDPETRLGVGLAVRAARYLGV